MDQQQQNPFNVQPGLSPYPVQQLDPSIAALILTPYDILDALRRTLQGERLEVELDKDGQRQEHWRKPDGVQPTLNDAGINFINSELISFVNRVATLSYIDDSEIEKIGRPTADNIAIALAQDYRKYGLEKTNYYVVNSIVTNLVYFVLKQAYMGGLQKLLKETTQRVETINNDRKGNKGGVLGFLPFGR